MTATIDILAIISSFKLKKNEAYHLYLLRNDEWKTYGYIDKYTDAKRVSELTALALANPDVFGVWVTIETGDGTRDDTIIKIEKSLT